MPELYFASKLGELEKVRKFIEEGADVNERRKDHGSSFDSIKGQTPLHVARTLKIAKELLNAGADIEARDDLGNTPLIIQSKSCTGEGVAEFLLENGADITAVNNKGLSAFARCGLAQNAFKEKYFQMTGKFLKGLNNTSDRDRIYIDSLEKEKTRLELDLQSMRKEVSDITERVQSETKDYQRGINTLNDELSGTRNNLVQCMSSKDNLDVLLKESQILLEARDKTLEECQENISELNEDIALITSRLVSQNSDLSADVNDSRERLRMALEEASRNSNSLQLGGFIQEMTIFMNSGDMNNHQLSVLESIMEDNIRQATTPEKVEALKIIFQKIKRDVKDRESTLRVLNDLESNKFKVSLLTKIGAHMRLF